jgi:isoquinoline 1-oxidoreductase beta subunit
MQTSRSEFIRVAVALGTGLSLGLRLPADAQSDVFAPNAWVRIAPDDTVTIILNKSEMGQGVIHGLPTILADELDADVQRIRTEIAQPNSAYIDPELGEQATGGSTAIHSTWLPLRRAGAAARFMLIAAAAKQWGVDPATCTTRAGVVYDATSNRSASYGTLAVSAGAQPVPTNIDLKPTHRFTLIGTARPRPDIPSKVNGTAQYGIDVRLPGMVYAAIARSPVFGGRVKHVDAQKAHTVPGVLEVFRISNGVAVVAKNTWAAFRGRDSLAITWEDEVNGAVTSAQLYEEAARLARAHRGERTALVRGNPATAHGTVLEATYRGPFLAHAHHGADEYDRVCPRRYVRGMVAEPGAAARPGSSFERERHPG